MQKVIVRREQPGDRAAVHAVEAAAFGRDDEACLVDRLRDSAVPFLSLVACAGARMVGHALFTPVVVAGTPAWQAMGLGPVAVLPAWQRQGIGRQLIRAGLAACRSLDYDVVFVLGHPTYYPRFGFRPAPPIGLTCQWEVPDEVFMVLELAPGALRGRQGLVRYHPAFDDV